MNRPTLIALATAVGTVGIVGAAAVAQQTSVAPAPTVDVRPILPPDNPLPSEAASAGVTRFSFIAYGDTRCDCRLPNSDPLTGLPAGPEVQREHSLVVDAMVKTIELLAPTEHPVRFVLSSGDAAYAGTDGTRWNDVFTPIIEKITRGPGLPFFYAVGNHDVTLLPATDPNHVLGLHNALAAISKLIPPDGSPRRLSGYATYAFGYGNTFFIAIDSNISADTKQLAWVTDQLEHLDRTRYLHVIAFFHHPLFTSGRYSAVVYMRSPYMPLFHKHHVRMTIAGHDHLFDHFVEHYVDAGVTYRMDDIVSGGGGAPSYAYTGEPDLQAYLAAGVSQQVRVEHLTKPGLTPDENPHHFVVVQVDGDRFSLEVVGSGPAGFRPYNGSSRIDLVDGQ